LNKGQWITFGALLSVPLFAIIVKFNQYEHYIVWIATFGILLSMIYVMKQVSVKARKQLSITIYFTVLMTVFWAIFEQAGSSLTLFADRNVELVLLNAAQTNSINGTFIILLAIPFSWLWSFLNRHNRNPNSAIKSGLDYFCWEPVF